ncbi:MAG: copper chaperone [Propionibacteriales bacterium]|nr:copper chaperone [Propionibacteriales bacterium]
METVVLQVDGMSCTGCEQRIGTVLRRAEGVRGVVADHVCGRVEVRIGPELVDRAELAERIEAAGYRVVEVPTP